FELGDSRDVVAWNRPHLPCPVRRRGLVALLGIETVDLIPPTCFRVVGILAAVAIEELGARCWGGWVGAGRMHGRGRAEDLVGQSRPTMHARPIVLKTGGGIDAGIIGRAGRLGGAAAFGAALAAAGDEVAVFEHVRRAHLSAITRLTFNDLSVERLSRNEIVRVSDGGKAN